MRWWGSAGRRNRMRDPHSSTSSPFWKTTLQPQSHSTSQATTSSLVDLGANSGVSSAEFKHQLTENFNKAADTAWGSSTTTLAYLQMQAENVSWSRGLSLVYLGTKYLGKCSGVQIGAGMLSSGNPSRIRVIYMDWLQHCDQKEIFEKDFLIISNLLADAQFFTF